MKTNSIKVIEPYRCYGGWVFDDPKVNLVREPFVGGADDLCEALATVSGKAHDRFTLVFSEQEFPGYQLHITLKEIGKVGQTYITDDKREAWLCPALLLYFEKPPKHIYAQAKNHIRFKRRPKPHPWQAYGQFPTSL